MSALREGAWRWAPAIIWMALIFVLSAQPGLAITEDASVDLPVRRAAHVVAYAILTILVARGLRAGTSPTRIAAAALIAVLYGVTDELHQSTVPDRTGRPDDVVIDALGALVGIAVLRFGPRRLTSR